MIAAFFVGCIVTLSIVGVVKARSRIPNNYPCDRWQNND